MTADLSILIPSRNEMFLSRTVEDILKNIEGDTEIIAVLDGAWADPGIPDNDRVTIIYHPESIGQRAATNEAARLSSAKYVMKCDAHCTFDKGFDVKMMKEMHDDWTMVPLMRNLHAFDWVCPEGHRRYQGPSGPCKECGKETVRDILWIAKESPKSISYCFDATPHFQYFREFSKRPEGQGDITETMSLQGSCWMLTRDKYWELNICDENFGSWGSQGIEVACKTWLSGGRVMVNKKTWYAHMFRTQGGDFSFPYPISGTDQKKAQSYARDMFFNSKWPKQKRPLSWLVEKFRPVYGWTDEDLAKLKAAEGESSTSRSADIKPAENKKPDKETAQDRLNGIIYISKNSELYIRSQNTEGFPVSEVYKLPRPKRPRYSSLSLHERAGDSPVLGSMYSQARIHPSAKSTGFSASEYNNKPTKGIIFYTHNQLKLKIAHAVQKRLKQISQNKHIPIVSASLKKMAFGDKNIHFPHLQRGYLAMFKQILGALENSTVDVIFFCEHDVLYHPSHFDFTPERKDIYYYNHNWWRLRLSDGLAVHWDANQVSGLCAYREHLLQFYRQRVADIEKRGYRNQGFEPGGRDTVLTQAWKSAYANIDIKHGDNLSKNRWSPHHFHDKSTVKNFTSTDEIPGWGKTSDIIKKLS